MNNTQRKLIKEAYKYGFNSAVYEQFVPDLGAPGGLVRDLERLSLQTPPEGSLLSRLQDLFFDSGYSKRQRSILDASLRGPEIGARLKSQQIRPMTQPMTQPMTPVLQNLIHNRN